MSLPAVTDLAVDRGGPSTDIGADFDTARTLSINAIADELTQSSA